MRLTFPGLFPTDRGRRPPIFDINDYINLADSTEFRGWAILKAQAWKDGGATIRGTCTAAIEVT